MVHWSLCAGWQRLRQPAEAEIIIDGEILSLHPTRLLSICNRFLIDYSLYHEFVLAFAYVVVIDLTEEDHVTIINKRDQYSDLKEGRVSALAGFEPVPIGTNPGGPCAFPVP